MALYDKISKVDEIMGRINTHPEYQQCLLRDEYHALRSEAEKHSLDMELQGDELISKAGDPIHIRDKHRAKAAMRLSETQEYLAKEGINLTTLSTLGYKIAPLINRYEGFRRELVAFGPFYGEESENIIYKVNDLLSSLQNSSVHPILRASNAHLETILIHPYLDGNGRAARLLQNQLLLERCYPPAIISLEEKKEYFKIIGGAIKDRINRKSNINKKSETENLFHEFIASKVLYSAKSVEDTLKSRRMYDVHLTRVSNFGIVRTLADALRSSGRMSGDKIVNVSIGKKNGGRKESRLKITGNISQDELKTTLKRFSDKYGFSYNADNSREPC
jgi:hypothetical protein